MFSPARAISLLARKNYRQGKGTGDAELPRLQLLPLSFSCRARSP